MLHDLWVEEPCPSVLTVSLSLAPVIAARPFTVPYLTALLPSELEMQQMEETDSSEQDDQTDTENLPLHMSTVRSAREIKVSWARLSDTSETWFFARLPRSWAEWVENGRGGCVLPGVND